MSAPEQTVTHATRRWLHASALLSATVALMHLVIILAGPNAYVFFGASDLGVREAAGSWLPDVITAGLVLLFSIWAYYAAAAAGSVTRAPPLLSAGLWLIAGIYTLRGLGAVPEVPGVVHGSGNVPPRFVAFSVVSLMIGLVHLRGAVLRQRDLRRALRSA